jgi:hypothetical protein
MRVFLAIGATVVLAVVAGTTANGSDAAPKAAQMGGVWFNARYQASFDATWRTSSPLQLPDLQHPFRCGGGDASGELTSSLQPKGKFKFWVGYDLGDRHLSKAYKPPNGNPMGIVTSNRTAQEFFMHYSGGQCVREDIAQPGCGAHTFTVPVMPLTAVGGRLDSTRNPIWDVELQWQLEPENIGCSDGISFPLDYDYGWNAAPMRARQLYRCGMKKPRGCKLTIGRDRTYVFDQTDGVTTYTTNMHVTWSIVLSAAGKG